MRNAIALVILLCVPHLARAEARSIALEIVRGSNSVLIVSIHSEVQTERKQNVSIAEAAKIMKDAKGWGSMVSVVILTDGAELREYMPILQAIADNAWLGLDPIRPRRGLGEHILKH